jgi:hypothetical protein
MSEIDPPNIWTFEESAAATCDDKNLKGFAPTGEFYKDTRTLCGMWDLKLHPLFRAPKGYDIDSADNKPKEPTTISCIRYRLDPSSMKVLFKALEGCANISTLK